jgi:hypothetical protein
VRLIRPFVLRFGAVADDHRQPAAERDRAGDVGLAVKIRLRFSEEGALAEDTDREEQETEGDERQSHDTPPFAGRSSVQPRLS